MHASRRGIQTLCESESRIDRLNLGKRKEPSSRTEPLNAMKEVLHRHDVLGRHLDFGALAPQFQDVIVSDGTKHPRTQPKN